KREPLARWNEPLSIAIEARDVGSVAVRDAVFLPSGQLLLALGEIGVSLRSREGKSVLLFDAPAHHLVISDGADRAIAVARRAEVCRLSRLDLARRTAASWCDARLDAFAPDYDGLHWFVATEDLYAIDATGRGFDGPWRVP